MLKQLFEIRVFAVEVPDVQCLGIPLHLFSKKRDRLSRLASPILLKTFQVSFHDETHLIASSIDPAFVRIVLAVNEQVRPRSHTLGEQLRRHRMRLLWNFEHLVPDRGMEDAKDLFPIGPAVLADALFGYVGRGELKRVSLGIRGGRWLGYRRIVWIFGE